MSLTDNRRKKGDRVASTIVNAAPVVVGQVPLNRQEEILDYLNLLGYKPDRTILQVHTAGFFNKRQANARAQVQREITARRYGGTTFVVVGRTHDPSIMNLVTKPKRIEKKPASDIWAICGRAKILRKEHLMKLFRLILLQSMCPTQ